MTDQRSRASSRADHPAGAGGPQGQPSGSEGLSGLPGGPLRAVPRAAFGHGYVAVVLRHWQNTDESFGVLFTSFNAFVDRTMEEFFMDTPDLPIPILKFEQSADQPNIRGYYQKIDGSGIHHRLGLNPMRIRNGEEAAEVIAHELVHLWQQYVGRPCEENRHTEEFHEQMMERYNIITEGPHGTLKGFHTPLWDAWMIENEDLRLPEFIFPGADS